MVDDEGQVWKKCPRFMIRGAEIALYRQISTWKSSATQTQFGIFWTLNFPWKPSIEFWGIMRREEKLKERQAVGKWQIQIKGRGLAPLNCLKGQPKGESTEKLAWKFKVDHCLCLKPWRRNDLPFVQGKPDTLKATLPQQWQQQRAHCWMLSWKLLPQRSLVSAHKMCPGFFQMKIFGCGWSRQCIQMAWWQKNW